MFWPPLPRHILGRNVKGRKITRGPYFLSALEEFVRMDVSRARDEQEASEKQHKIPKRLPKL